MLSRFESACGESPFAQSSRVALAVICQRYNPGGNELGNEAIGMTESDISLMSAGSNTILVMNGTIEVIAPPFAALAL